MLGAVIVYSCDITTSQKSWQLFWSTVSENWQCTFVNWAFLYFQSIYTSTKHFKLENKNHAGNLTLYNMGPLMSHVIKSHLKQSYCPNPHQSKSDCFSTHQEDCVRGSTWEASLYTQTVHYGGWMKMWCGISHKPRSADQLDVQNIALQWFKCLPTVVIKWLISKSQLPGIFGLSQIG